jgi:hypothetical protein
MFFKENNIPIPYFGVSKSSKNFFPIRKKKQEQEKKIFTAKKLSPIFWNFYFWWVVFNENKTVLVPCAHFKMK